MWQTCNRTKVYTRISARPYAATAPFTRSFSLRYLFADGWSTPVTTCKKNDFWRCTPFFSRGMKVHMVGWWHRIKSDCMPWCRPSTELVQRAMPSTAPACWFHVSTDNSAAPYEKSHLESNTNIAVRWTKSPHRYWNWNSRAIWDHTVLPATRQRWHYSLYPSRSWYSI